MTFAGHVTVGISESKTVTANVHVPVLLAASVAVHVTVVVPTGNAEPDAGTHATVVPGQLSKAGGVVNVTSAVHCPVALPLRISPGQVRVGASVSEIVTVNEQVGPAVVEQFTVVVPTGNVEPEAGVQVTVPQPIVVVGAG